MLLYPNNTPRSTNSAPSNRFLRRKIIKIHNITSNQRPSSPQPRLTMYSYCPRLLPHNLQKSLHNLHTRHTPILKIQIMNSNPPLSKHTLIILYPIQSNHCSNPLSLENWNIVFRFKATPPKFAAAGRGGTTEGEDLIRNYPVHVPILKTLHGLVLGNFESSEVVPTQIQGALEGLKAVGYCTFVAARSHAGVAKRFEGVGD